MGSPVMHFDIGCRDLGRSCAFYSAVFGWTTSPMGPLSSRFDTGSPRGIAGHTTALGHEPHQYVLVYMEVDDIDAVLAKIETEGGAIVIPKTAVPTGGWFAWFTDPSGNTLGLWTPPEPAL